MTGGFVYRGRKFPKLVGTYVFGDWETRRIWGATVDGETIGPRDSQVIELAAKHAKKEPITGRPADLFKPEWDELRTQALAVSASTPPE